MKTADFPSVKEARKEAMRRMEFYQRMMMLPSKPQPAPAPYWGA